MQTLNNKRLEHPLTSYLIGSVFIILTLAVFAGVVHHLTLSHHGPGLLVPVMEKFFAEPPSSIIAEAKRQQEFEVHRHFHRIAEFKQLPETERTVCYICHSDYPHSKNIETRSLLNMHTQYSVCETCHLKEQPEAATIYKWYSPLDPNPAGPFFGTHYDPATGRLARVEDLVSKITPYLENNDRLDSAIQVQDAPLARDYMKVRDQLNAEQREGIKNKFHVNIKPKGHDCQACHAQNGLLDLKTLGFADKRVNDLQRLNIKDAITQDEEIYLPKLFN